MAIKQKGRVYYYHADGLGSITALTDERGKVVQRYKYDSFGNMKHHGKKVKQPYTFTGREWDGEIGLYYYRARYYDPKVGRFISFDPILHPVDGQILKINYSCGKSSFSYLILKAQNFNPYVYVLNMPINKTDPSGLVVVRSMCLECNLSGLWGCLQNNLYGVSKGTVECIDCIKGIVSSRGTYFPPSCAECITIIGDIVNIYSCIDNYCNTYIVEWDTDFISMNNRACKCAAGKPKQKMGINTLGRPIYGVDLTKDCDCR